MAPVTKKKIWVDLENSPHVPFFKPIIEELEKRGNTVMVTARDCFQVCALADLLHLPYRRIGRHYGKNKLAKAAGLLIRSMQMIPAVMREKPDLAVSHGSRSQLLVTKMLNIPSAIIFDYEHTKRLPFEYGDMVIAPEMIPDNVTRVEHGIVRRYPGIKEDVYAPRLKPDPGILERLGIDNRDVVVIVRPPATEAHYHRHESDEMFNAAMELLTSQPALRIILLPRNQLQEAGIRQRWPEWFDSRKIVVPDKVVDGLNLIWHADLVISGGGTMNREAAALGVPVYSIFRGEIGAVNQHLSECGRLIMLESVSDLSSKIIMKKWRRPEKPDTARRPALQTIVEALDATLCSR